MFRRAPKKPHPDAIRLQDIQNPLALVPHQIEQVESKTNEDATITLRLSLKPRNRMEAFTTRVFRMHRRAQLNLDEVGTRFWTLIDGKRTLKQIAKELSHRYRFSRNESREAVIVFTRRLLVRGFVTVNIPDKEQAWHATS